MGFESKIEEYRQRIDDFIEADRPATGADKALAHLVSSFEASKRLVGAHRPFVAGLGVAMLIAAGGTLAAPYIRIEQIVEQKPLAASAPPTPLIPSKFRMPESPVLVTPPLRPKTSEREELPVTLRTGDSLVVSNAVIGNLTQGLELQVFPSRIESLISERGYTKDLPINHFAVVQILEFSERNEFQRNLAEQLGMNEYLLMSRTYFSRFPSKEGRAQPIWLPVYDVIKMVFPTPLYDLSLLKGVNNTRLSTEFSVAVMKGIMEGYNKMLPEGQKINLTEEDEELFRRRLPVFVVEVHNIILAYAGVYND